MKARAAIAVKRGEPLRVEQIEVADPGRGQVRVRVEACGICRSDLHALDGGEDVVLPAVLGHEAAGVVEACGPGVERLGEGDRVILSWTPACGVCPSCRRGEVNLCAGIRMSAGSDSPLTWNGQGLDRFMALGAFCEYVVIPETMAIAFRGDIPATQACLIGCAVMTGFGAATKTAAVGEGESVVVLGCGGVGLSAVQGARVAGASRIFAVDPSAERRNMALRLGATDVLVPDQAAAAISSLANGGVDVAIECVGAVETMRKAFELTRPGGRAVVVGLPKPGELLTLDPFLLLFEKSIKGSMYGSADPASDFPALVSLQADGRLDLAGLVSGTRCLDEINEGLAETRQGSIGRIVIAF